MMLMQGIEWVFHIVISRARSDAFSILSFHTGPHRHASKVAAFSPNHVSVVSLKLDAEVKKSGRGKPT